ncbi:MAG: beta-ketoacyl synthase N-terminal-like domain-containing protein, partial [Pseudomonadota bacterium]
MSKRRVVVTGMGALTPVGIGLETSWNAMVAGQSGVGMITSFDASGLACSIAAEVPEFDPEHYLSQKEAKKMDRFMVLGIAAGIEAFRDSGLEVTELNAPRMGA